MGQKISALLREEAKRALYYVQVMVKWGTVAVVIGILSGVIGTAFHIAAHEAAHLREHHAWLLWGLPVAGIAIVGLYKLTKTEGVGTNAVLEAVRLDKPLSILLLPAIFVGTVLTQLCGGSGGREGAALQMGGTIGYNIGGLFRLDERDQQTATMAGMAAFFAAVFGTPLAATVFSIVIASIGAVYHAAFVPCLTASLVAYGISLRMGAVPTRLTVVMPELEPVMLLKVAVLSVLFALVARLFCGVMHFVEHEMARRFPNPWVRVIVGAFAVVGLTYLCGTTDYNGAGMEIATIAVEQGTVAHPAAFLLKLLFTAISLAAGFKGGEVVPAFFVGATFGCVVGPLLGIPAGAAAALGLVAVFCGAINCPLASIVLAVELYGDGGLLYFALTCGISYMLSGYNGLYSSQIHLYSKLKAQYINVRTNNYRTGDPHDEPPVRKSLKE